MGSASKLPDSGLNLPDSPIKGPCFQFCLHFWKNNNVKKVDWFHSPLKISMSEKGGSFFEEFYKKWVIKFQVKVYTVP